MTEKEAWLDEPTWEQLKHEAFEVLNNPKLQRADILAIGREPTYLSFCANNRPGVSAYLPIAQIYIYVEAADDKRSLKLANCKHGRTIVNAAVRWCQDCEQVIEDFFKKESSHGN